MGKRLDTAFHAGFGILMLTLLAVCCLTWEHNAPAALAAAAVLGAGLVLVWHRLGPWVQALSARRFRLLFLAVAALWLALLLAVGSLLREVLLFDLGGRVRYSAGISGQWAPDDKQ